MKISDESIIEACNTSMSMAEASTKVSIHFNTFRKRALKLGVYKPNQSGKGMTKRYNGKNYFPLKEILEGKHPQYQTNKLRKRLIREGIKEEKCEKCGIEDWLGERVSFELNHIDGIRTNHLLDNLEILCPNCHSQTPTYRGKNVKR